MPYEKAPSSGAFLVLSLMHILSGEPMHDLSGVDTRQIVDRSRPRYSATKLWLAPSDRITISVVRSPAVS